MIRSRSPSGRINLSLSLGRAIREQKYRGREALGLFG